MVCIFDANVVWTGTLGAETRFIEAEHGNSQKWRRDAQAWKERRTVKSGECDERTPAEEIKESSGPMDRQ